MAEYASMVLFRFTMRNFKIEDSEPPEIIPSELKAEIKTVEATTTKELKKKINDAFSREINQVQEKKQEPEVQEKSVTISCKDGKVDMSELNIQTGVIASVELRIMDDGSFNNLLCIKIFI